MNTGTVPASESWLQQTTYLVDKSGHTTAVLAQTDQPTGSVSLATMPYTTQAQAVLPSTTADDFPSGWTYQGCYIDAGSSARTIRLRQPDNSLLTVKSCVWLCYQLGYAICGLEFQMECFCGNAISNERTLAPVDSDCNMPCSGNTREVCGAANRLSVYSNGTIRAAYPTSITPVVKPSPTGATSRTPILATAGVIGVVAGITITVALVCYFIRRIRSNRLGAKGRLLISQATPPTERDPSWEEESVKRAAECNVRVKSPAKDSWSQRAPAPAHLGQPLSILKRAAPTELAYAAKGTFYIEDEQVPRYMSSTKTLASAKKGVRFGVNQIREFGMSPFLGHGSEI